MTRRDFRIIIKQSNAEISGQIFQNIAAAGSAAGMKEKMGLFPALFFKSGQNPVQFFLIISFIHNISSRAATLNKLFWKNGRKFRIVHF